MECDSTPPLPTTLAFPEEPASPAARRELKRRSTHLDCSAPAALGSHGCSATPSQEAPKVYGQMDPPSRPPPFKRANSGACAALPLPFPLPAERGGSSAAKHRTPSRALRQGVSWSEILSQSQGDSQPEVPILRMNVRERTPEGPRTTAPHTPCGSPRTPGPRSRRPPSPPRREPVRRRPLSDDDPSGKEDLNDGRFAQEFADVVAIGEGQFSTVYRARNRLDNHIYAVKKTTRISRGMRQSQLREIFALAAVAVADAGCPNIVRYFSSWMEDGRLHIQTEICSCSLRDVMAKGADPAAVDGDQRFDAPRLLSVLQDVAMGLAALHTRKFVHMDIKPDNILVGPSGPNGASAYKIADLGLAAAAMGSNCDDVSEGDCRYLAKEVMKGDLAQLPKADVFSLGLVCHELATNPRPLPCNGDQWQRLRSGGTFAIELLHQTLQERPPLLDLLRSMAHENPESRPPCEEVLQHRCVAPVDKLEEERNQRIAAEAEAQRRGQQAQEYFQELLSMKKQELLGGSGGGAASGDTVAKADVIAGSGRRPIASVQRRATADW